VLEQGKIVERGRHDDLLARNHLYAAMWRRQQDGDGEDLIANADSESAEPV
jgi:ABC-type transport system involved in cytochrome bd biosynthesis fused ATPase/permease subunit